MRILLSSVFAFGLFTVSAVAQEWPTRPITLMVAGGAGSAGDIIGRLVGEELSDKLGVNVVVDPRPAAGGNVAMEAVASANPDGYTLGLITMGTHAINPGLYEHLPFDPLEDFTPITSIASVTNILTVNSSNPADSVADIIAEAKSNPGEVTFASAGVGTSTHLSGVLFGNMADIQLLHVPYRGTPAGLAAVASGEAMMGFFSPPATLPLIEAGKLKPLAVTSAQGSALLPDVPSLDEEGLKGYDVSLWYGVSGPAGLPETIVKRVYHEISAIFQDQDFRTRMTERGFDLMEQMPPHQFAEFIAAEHEKWMPIVEASGAKTY